MQAVQASERSDMIWVSRAEWEAKNQRIAQLEAEVAELKALVSKLTRQIYGKRTEKLPSIKRELKKQEDPAVKAALAGERRKKRQEVRHKQATTVQIQHPLPESQHTCPHCLEKALRLAGQKESVLLEFVPPHFERQVHTQETWACPGCDYIVTSQGPSRPIEGGQYGPGFIAHVIVSKCLDCIPFYRMQKQFERIGIPMARSTFGDLFHQAAHLLEPLHKAMQSLVLGSALVLADETPLKVLEPGKGKTHRGYVWTFLTDEVAYYCYSHTRSGETPQQVLQNSSGTLMADGYTGYNVVTTPETRERAGCWAHARRKFFEAKETAPNESQHMMDEILALYQIEYEAVQRRIEGKPIHTQLRRERAGPILKRIHEWLLTQQPHHLPNSPLGRGITYALNQWTPLNHYLSDAQIPIDNNRSEQALRVIALGRKNYLFAGHETAAQNLAVLESLVNTCEMHGINPEAYLSDVLIRIQTHPNKDILDLMPHRWKELFAPNIHNSLYGNC